MSIDGNWRLTVDTPVGKQSVNLALRTEDGALRGTVTDDHGTLDTAIFDGNVDDGSLSFKVKVPRPVPMTLAFAGTYAADVFDGKVKMGIFGKRPGHAVRV